MNCKIVLFTLFVFGVSIAIFSLQLPSAEAIIWVEGHITTDTTWFPVDTYRIVGNTYVDPGVTLTILPGVRVEFADGFSLIIEGNLNATGTDANPIVFTSSRVSPSAGMWNTVHFKGAPTSYFILKHVRVEFATNGITIESEGLAKVSRSRIFNCSESGIMIKGISNVIIEDNILKYNRNGISTDDRTHAGIIISRNNILFNVQNGIYFYSGSGPIYNVTISSNDVSSNGGNGIYFQTTRDSSPIYNVAISSNDVSSNKGDGIYICTESSSPIYNIIISLNNIALNRRHGIYLYTFRRKAHIYNVTFSSNIVSFNSETGIRLAALTYGEYGEYSEIYNITFSFNNIRFNNEYGIYVSSEDYEYVMNTRIYNVTFFSNIISGSKRGILVYGYKPSVAFCIVASGNKIMHNYCGLIFAWVNSNITENSIAYNDYGVYYHYSRDNFAKWNDIYLNRLYGMGVSSEATVKAEYNYWGNTSGPYHPSLNPEGKGNQVNGNGVDLDFIPFLTGPYGHINQRPVAALTVDKTTANVNETVTFDATGSTDDGRIDYYLFIFGDGTDSGWTTLPVVTHTYTKEGKYTATVIVMDDYGITSINQEEIEVQIIVVPEFPSTLILTIFMLTTLMATAIWKAKKH